MALILQCHPALFAHWKKVMMWIETGYGATLLCCTRGSSVSTFFPWTLCDAISFCLCRSLSRWCSPSLAVPRKPFSCEMPCSHSLALQALTTTYRSQQKYVHHSRTYDVWPYQVFMDWTQYCACQCSVLRLALCGCRYVNRSNTSLMKLFLLRAVLYWYVCVSLFLK